MKRVGTGGFGLIVACRPKWLEESERVAVKILPSTTAKQRQDIKREVLILEKMKTISSLYTIPILSSFQLSENYFALTMPYMEMGPVTNLKKFYPESIALIGTDIVNAVYELHRQGIIHNDLSPNNVMLLPTSIQLIDFGLSLTISDVLSGVVARPNSIYTPPEHIVGGYFDHGVDIWGIGVILYHMANGRFPFSGYDISDVHEWVVHGVMDPPEKDIDPDLQDLIENLLQKHPLQRIGYGYRPEAVLEILDHPFFVKYNAFENTTDSEDDD